MPPPEQTTANAPFNGESFSDIIFTTADDIDFYLVKAILVYASPFFADMFSLHQPSDIAHPTGDPERIPISENSHTFEALVRYCYPVDDPVLSEVGELEKVLEAALKYQASEAAKILRKLLQGVVTSTDTALRVYAIACRLMCEEEAMVAADYLKNVGIGSHNAIEFSTTVAGAVYIPEMASVTAAAYHRLLAYLKPNGTKPPSFLEPAHTQRQHSDNQNVEEPVSPSSRRLPPDAILRSSDGTDIPVHRAILQSAGAEKLMEGAAEGEEGRAPIYQVDVPAEVLRDIVRLCYHFQPHDVTGLHRLAAVVIAAEKYGIEDAIGASRRQLMSMAERAPLAAYFIADQHGWKEETLAAARSVALHHLEAQYATEMEDVPAFPYHRLLQFCHRFKNAVKPYLANRNPPYYESYPSDTANTTPTLPLPVVLIEMAMSTAQALIRSQCGLCTSNINYGGHYHQQSCLYRASTQDYPRTMESIFGQIPRWEATLWEVVSKLELDVDEDGDA